MKYFTSDLHLGHWNITSYTDRKNVVPPEEHDSWVISLLNSTLKPGDELWILGDVDFKEISWELLKPISSNGVFINVIKGNHDSSKTLNKVKEQRIIKAWYHYHEIKVKDINTCLFHFPITSWNWRRYGSYHLFGHLHGNKSSATGRCLDVGLDSAYNIFGEHKLFSEDEVHKILSAIDFKNQSHHNTDSNEYKEYKELNNAN